MKTVVLVGDSIRMGYEGVVRNAFRGLAEVVGPKENGGDSANVLRRISEWAVAPRPDVVHVNCGLHDIKREFGRAERAVSLCDYGANVRRILSLLRAETDATVVWASTTPVDEELHHRNKPFDRFERDVVACNAAASEVAAELGVPVNDLHGLVCRAGREKYLNPDGVHFTREGYELLGAAVAEFIAPYL